MFEEAIEYLPILIRITALVIVVAVLYDFFKRKWAKLIVDAVTSAGADSPENAVSTAQLEEQKPGIKKMILLLLRHEYSTLRRCVLCVKPSSDRAEDTKKRKKRSDRLTGEEKWYILPDPAVKESNDADDHTDEDGSSTVRDRSTPALLRLGGDGSPVKLIIGCVLTVAFSELIIYFLPQIVGFFTEISRLGRD